jgi:hypothetical protein
VRRARALFGRTQPKPKPSRQAALSTLAVFNEQAEKLTSLRFLERVRTGVGDYLLEGQVGSPVEVVGYLAEVDDLDAFVATFRMFIQNNEAISIGSIDQLYQNLPELAPFAARVRRIREVVNRYLDANSTIVWQKTQITRRRILEVFVCGAIAHTNREKRAEHKRWVQTKHPATRCGAMVYESVRESVRTTSMVQALQPLHGGPGQGVFR